MFIYEYKKQGDNRDSWVRIEVDEFGTETGFKDMVYEDPNKKPIPDIDLVGLFQNLRGEEKIKLTALIREMLK